ncbi:hypothetical protein [Sphingobium chungbukense]|nr:hypothetical protein [Sphingobium chungbukense]
MGKPDQGTMPRPARRASRADELADEASPAVSDPLVGKTVALVLMREAKDALEDTGETQARELLQAAIESLLKPRAEAGSPVRN